MNCRLCSDPVHEDGLCLEHALAEQMTPEITGIVMCGACGAEADAETEGWIVRASFYGGDPWARCAECVAKFKREKRREDALRKGEEARSFPIEKWCWLRNRFEGAICVLCGEDVELEAKTRYLRPYGVAHPGCVRNLGVQQSKARGTLTLAS